MPSGKAAEMRALVATENVADDELKLAPRSKTGYIGVIVVGLKYQARIQVPGDGRGGTAKRRQYSVPGLFDTAKEAAIIRASIMKGMLESNAGRLFVPPKQNKQHKARTVKTQPTPAAASPPPVPLQQPMATTVAMPLSVPMWQLPFAAVSPLPMQQIGYFPPRF